MAKESEYVSGGDGGGGVVDYEKSYSNQLRQQWTYKMANSSFSIAFINRIHGNWYLSTVQRMTKHWILCHRKSVCVVFFVVVASSYTSKHIKRNCLLFIYYFTVCIIELVDLNGIQWSHSSRIRIISHQPASQRANECCSANANRTTATHNSILHYRMEFIHGKQCITAWEHRDSIVSISHSLRPLARSVVFFLSFVRLVLLPTKNGFYIYFSYIKT